MSQTEIHNAPTCTCQRIIWMTAICTEFSLEVGKDYVSIRARLDDAYLGSDCHPTQLANAVEQVFGHMWQAWVPASGVKAG